MIGIDIIIFCIAIGFGLPSCIAILVYKLNDGKSARGIPVSNNRQLESDVERIRFYRETKFWSEYNKE